MRLTNFAYVAGFAACMVVLANTADADAGGGTFCDNPGQNQPPMPVDQTGENILFAFDGEYVEAHVQIQYTGDPERFAWVVPVPAMPELSVGSQPLFLSLLNSTVPTFQISNSFAACDMGGSGVGSSSNAGCSFGLSSADEASAGYGFGGPTGEDTTDERADVEEIRESVGAFDVTIIEASSAADVSLWLSDNGFLDEPEAEPILDDYVQAGFKFVAVKLRPGAGVDEIHPLVIRYLGDQPCIPLKLTRIAATEDMGVRAFFFGDERIAPVSYRHVTLNPAQLDWLNLATNYNDVVSKAVDEASNGRAFITEYAGTSSVVNLNGVWSSSWYAAAFEQIEPTDVVDELRSQGLITCTTSQSCSATHPLVLTLLRTYLPAPAEIGEAQFYSCVSCYQEMIDIEAWDAVAFAGDFDAMIVSPATRARDMVNTSSYLTRLFTTLSPDEMLADPTFARAGDELGDVTGARSATIVQECDGRRTASLTGGHDVNLGLGSIWPELDPEMPYAERIEQYDEQGELAGEIDNGDKIDELLETQGGVDSITVNANDESDDSGGCACRLGAPAQGHGLAFLGTLALAALRRVRRKRARSSRQPPALQRSRAPRSDRAVRAMRGRCIGFRCAKTL